MAVAVERKTPPELLHELLREDRAAGFTFDDVFAENVAIAAGCGAGWRDALMSTRSTWRDCWDNAPGPRSSVTRDLADGGHRDRVPSGGVVIG
jgi:hypothetical protein